MLEQSSSWLLPLPHLPSGNEARLCPCWPSHLSSAHCLDAAVLRMILLATHSQRGHVANHEPGAHTQSLVAAQDGCHT
jgi:hypothetical protein